MSGTDQRAEPTVSDMMAELREWYQRSDTAAFHDEPLYVTPDEYVEIKRLFSVPRVADSGYGPRSVDPYFVGTPVVIDAEKAAEQRSRG